MEEKEKKKSLMHILSEAALQKAASYLLEGYKALSGHNIGVPSVFASAHFKHCKGDSAVGSCCAAIIVINLFHPTFLKHTWFYS